MQLNLQQLAFIARAFYTTGKRGNQVTYLMLLKQKRDLSIDEFTVYMDGIRSPSTGLPLQRKQIYSTLYAMDKAGLVRKERFIGDAGASANVYYITPAGEEIVAEFTRMLENMDSIEPMVTANLFSSAQFLNRKSSEITH